MWLNITFSYIYSKLGNTKMSRKFWNKLVSPLLNIGQTLAIFNWSGKIPAEKEQFVIEEIRTAIYVIEDFIMLTGIWSNP